MITRWLICFPLDHFRYCSNSYVIKIHVSSLIHNRSKDITLNWDISYFPFLCFQASWAPSALVFVQFTVIYLITLSQIERTCHLFYPPSLSHVYSCVMFFLKEVEMILSVLWGQTITNYSCVKCVNSKHKQKQMFTRVSWYVFQGSDVVLVPGTSPRTWPPL